LEQNRQNRYLY